MNTQLRKNNNIEMPLLYSRPSSFVPISHRRLSIRISITSDASATCCDTVVSCLKTNIAKMTALQSAVCNNVITSIIYIANSMQHPVY
jgi:hypothetical protein